MASARSDTEGYDYEFVPPVEDDLVCAICQLALKEPVQTKCGHRFCQECLAKFHRGSPRRSCPMDNQTLTPQEIFLDVATKRKMLSHIVKCPNEGCDWTGELRKIDGHREQCVCELVDCPANECSMKVAKVNLSWHQSFQCRWRDCKCYYCKELEHELTCPKFPVKCSNNCRPGELIPCQ